MNALSVCLDALRAARVRRDSFLRLEREVAIDPNLKTVVGIDPITGMSRVCMTHKLGEHVEGRRAMLSFDFVPDTLQGVEFVSDHDARNIAMGLSDQMVADMVEPSNFCRMVAEDMAENVAALEQGIDRVEREHPELTTELGLPRLPSEFVVLGRPAGSILCDAYDEMLALVVVVYMAEKSDKWDLPGAEELMKFTAEKFLEGAVGQSTLVAAGSVERVERVLGVLRSPREARAFSLHWSKLKAASGATPAA